MRTLARLWRRLCFYLRRDRFERELDEEMRFHLEMRAREGVEEGALPDEAEAAARRRFGNQLLARERAVDVWSVRWADDFVRDARLAVRMLGKHRGLSAVAVLSLALGIGANTALFSVVDAMLLRPLPVRDPDRLVLFRSVAPPDFPTGGYAGYDSTDAAGRRSMTSFPYESFRRMRDASSALSDVFAFGDVTLSVGADGRAAVATGQAVSGNYYTGLGVPPALGRVLDDEDDTAGASPVAVLSYRFWRQRFGGDPAVIGRQIDLNTVPFTVVGVTPEGFEGTMQAGSTEDVTIAIAWEPRLYADSKASRMSGGGQWWLRVMGRLEPGATAEAARAELEPAFLESVAERFEARRAEARGEAGPGSGVDADAQPLLSLAVDPGERGEMDERARYAPWLYVLLGTVGLLLLVACANVANLLLARAAARRTEIGVRMALGATRARLVRQLLTESVLLAGLGGSAGLGVALWIKDGLLVATDWGGSAMRGLDARLDWRVLGFTAALSLATGVVFGIAPAWRASRADLTPSLKDGGRGSGTGPRAALGRGLVVLQIALSLVLLVGAGLFVRTLANLRGVDTGFDAANLLLFDVKPGVVGYDEARATRLYEQLAERLEGVPGVEEVTFSRVPLLARIRSTHGVYLAGAWLRPPDARGKLAADGQCHVDLVRENFLDVMGIRLVAGRALDARDDAKAPRVVVVNEKFAQAYFAGENPVGRRFSFDASAPDRIEIVGVARDAKYARQREDTPPTAFIPWRQETGDLGAVTFELRTAGDPLGVVSAVREAASETDASLPLDNVRTQADEADRTLATERVLARLAALFGVLAEQLAAIGLFGVMAYAVAQRTREIGVRMALGASPGVVLRGILAQGMALALAGTVLGVAGALVLLRTLESRLGLSRMLYGVDLYDPLTYAASALLVATVALLACSVPAWRATKVDPLVALRSE